MIPAREDLPDDAADWNTVEVVLPRLPDDSPESCPYSLDAIMDYIRIESADLDDADPARLSFVRTASIGEARSWIWSYTESDGEVCFVTFSVREDGSSMLGLAAPNGLTPEQHLLADYYGEIYWS